MSAREFSLQLTKEWADKVDDISEAISGIGLVALSGVVKKSPVETGRFRGNWVVSVGSLSDEIVDATDKNGGLTINKGSSVLDGYPKNFPVINIQNNLPYANRLENGYSKKAPAGMVALTIAEIAAASEDL